MKTLEIKGSSGGAASRNQMISLVRALIAAEAHRLMVEVHHDPDHAMSDGSQSLYPAQFETRNSDL